MPDISLRTLSVRSLVAADGASSRGASSAAPARASFPPEQIVAFAEKVEKTLAAQGAQVAILARIGRPAAVLPAGIRFTHVAFAVYSELTEPDGSTLSSYAIHNLYQLKNAPDKSELVQDIPVAFFSAVHELEAGIIVPTAAL